MRVRTEFVTRSNITPGMPMDWTLEEQNGLETTDFDSSLGHWGTNPVVMTGASVIRFERLDVKLTEDITFHEQKSVKLKQTEQPGPYCELCPHASLLLCVAFAGLALLKQHGEFPGLFGLGLSHCRGHPQCLGNPLV